MADYPDIKKKYQELSEQLNDPSVTSDPQKLKEVSQEYSELKETVSKIEDLEQKENEMKDAKEMLQDPEMKEEAEREISNLKPQISNLKSELEFDLLPQDPRDKNDVIMEIRAGAGGDEAGLFAADLYRMYTRFAEEKGWSSNLISSNRTGIGGFKEIIFEIKGQNAYKMLKYESGVHRVQRVPETEKSGRIHTSTVTVAVMPLIQKEEINIKPGDLKIDVYRASGAGGQHVNKTESAVRVTHIPTGAVASCQSERSQQRNREKAMAVLAARIADAEEEKRMKEEGDMRKSQVGTGDRSEKIRTYNYPQDRVTDHRIKLTTKNLNEIIDGNLEKFTEALIKADNEAKQNR